MINIGIIGCGYWGPNLIRNYYQLPNCNMLICCDLDQKKLDRMKTLYPGILTTNDVKAVLNNQEIDQ